MKLREEQIGRRARELERDHLSACDHCREMKHGYVTAALRERASELLPPTTARARRRALLREVARDPKPRFDITAPMISATA